MRKGRQKERKRGKAAVSWRREKKKRNKVRRRPVYKALTLVMIGGTEQGGCSKYSGGKKRKNHRSRLEEKDGGKKGKVTSGSPQEKVKKGEGKSRKYLASVPL